MDRMGSRFADAMALVTGPGEDVAPHVIAIIADHQVAARHQPTHGCPDHRQRLGAQHVLDIDEQPVHYTGPHQIVAILLAVPQPPDFRKSEVWSLLAPVDLFTNRDLMA